MYLYDAHAGSGRARSVSARRCQPCVRTSGRFFGFLCQRRSGARFWTPAKRFCAEIVPRWSRHAEHDLPGTQHEPEEHTSELQSPCNLVCRLLLEKKKKNKNKHT